MLSYTFIFSIFGITTFFAFYGVRKQQSVVVFALIAIACCCFAFLRSDTVDKDYETYKMLYDSYDDLTAILTEPTFIFISYIVRTFFQNNIFYLFVIYAILGVGVKMIAIKRLTEFYMLSTLIYLSTFFLLHEMTQIRVGVASGFLLLSIPAIYERNFLKFLLFTIIAVSFHYSSAVILPLYFLLRPGKINSWIYILLIVAVYSLHFLNIHFTALLAKVPLENVQFKLEANEKYSLWSGDKVNVLNVLQLIRLSLAMFFLKYADNIADGNKYGYIFIKFYIVGLCAMVFFADIPVFAVRTSELLGVVEIILLPCIMYVINPRAIAAILVMGMGLLFLCTTLFYTKLLHF